MRPARVPIKDGRTVCRLAHMRLMRRIFCSTSGGFSVVLTTTYTRLILFIILTILRKVELRGTPPDSKVGKNYIPLVHSSKFELSFSNWPLMQPSPAAAEKNVNKYCMPLQCTKNKHINTLVWSKLCITVGNHSSIFFLFVLFTIRGLWLSEFCSQCMSAQPMETK